MQPQKTACAGCGAELLPEARFCRKCGQPSSPLGRASVTEVTTRRLETRGQDLPGQQASLAQSSRGQTEQSLSAQTQSLTKTRALKRWLPGLLLLLLLILLPTTYLLWKWRSSTAAIPPPTGAPAQEGPVAPQPPQPPAPPQPPSAPAAKGTDGTTAIDQSFIYPGARTTMDVTKAGGGSVLQLETTDPVDKVADWYVKRLNPTKTVRMSGVPVVLTSDQMKAVITQSGEGTTILLKRN